jgi:hypothetical protein
MAMATKKRYESLLKSIKIPEELYVIITKAIETYNKTPHRGEKMFNGPRLLDDALQKRHMQHYFRT